MKLGQLMLLTLAAFAVCMHASAQDVPWPAESMSAAENLTHIEGPGINDFHTDLSGAFWNPATRRLWLCRNGPSSLTSKIWVIREDDTTGYQCDVKSGMRGEWTGFGDLEDITQAALNENTIYAIVEGEERIKEFDVSIYGVAVQRNNWNIAPFVPTYNGSAGSEGIAFVPDANLITGGFMDQNGNPRMSQNGMGGLMFVAHQNGGMIYVFDLNRLNSTFSYVGRYRTNFTESCGLAFDRQSGYLYVLHGNNRNTVEVVLLSSILDQGERRFNELHTYATPPGGAGLNMEGLALVSDFDCSGNARSFFLTIDDGGPDSLFRFRNFSCTVSADMDGNKVVDGRDIDGFVTKTLMNAGKHPGVGFEPGDMNMDGLVDTDDIPLFIDRLLTLE